VTTIVMTLVIAIFTFICYTQMYHIYKYGVLRHLSKIQFGHITLIDGQTNTIIKDIVRTLTPHVNITIYDPRSFYKSLAKDGEVGLGESYTSGVWECDNILNLMDILILNMDVLEPKQATYKIQKATYEHDKTVIKSHYDIGPDFYKTFLTDDLMAYTCGFFFCPTDKLNDAQYNKVDMIIRKMNITQPNQDILDIGCGWGHIASYVQKATQSKVDGLTISKEQAEYMKTHNSVQCILGHYQDLPTKGKLYDKIYSIGMLEHVRCANYDMFFQTVKSIMKPGARFVLHTITTKRDDTRCGTGSSKIFVTKHIFPGGQIPKIEWVLDAATRAGLQLVHLETFGGHHYAKTLQLWRENMLSSRTHLLSLGYDTQKIKAYEYYFAQCESAFKHNHMQLSHFVFDNVVDTWHIDGDVYTCSVDT